MGLYTSIVRPLAFRLEAEHAHHLAIKLGGFTLGGIGTATFGAIILYHVLAGRDRA